MKPTQIKIAEGGLNQIPPWTEVQGDIRLTPFYNINVCRRKVESYVAALNTDMNMLLSGNRGTCSKYDITIAEGDFKGHLEIKWEGEPFKGIACKLDSIGYEALKEATELVLGECKPYSITGSLPLVGDMQEAGFDIQICGYGHTAVYHGDNEYCTLSHMKDAMKIFCYILNKFN